MRIGDRAIGPGEPPYLIAEIGVNHDGDGERALALTAMAAEAGADAVKLQFFETDRLLSSTAKLAAYQRSAGETDPVAMLRRLELDLGAMGRAVDRAHKLGLHAIVTVFSVELVGPCAALPWDAFKSASPDVINRPLLDALAGTGRPLIVSTGASELDEVERARAWLDRIDARLAFLQCVSSYPAPEAALGGIVAVGAATGLPTGYSDHTASIETGAAAVEAGACVLERHLTDDRTAPGPDHAASLEPAEFSRYAAMARRAGPGDLPPARKEVLECERDVRTVSRQSLVTTRPVDAGETLGPDDLTVKRPGTGIMPWRLGEVAGRRVSRAVAADVPLTETDLA